MSEANEYEEEDLEEDLDDMDEEIDDIGEEQDIDDNPPEDGEPKTVEIHNDNRNKVVAGNKKSEGKGKDHLKELDKKLNNILEHQKDDKKEMMKLQRALIDQRNKSDRDVARQITKDINKR